jgi:hypothetical protein
MVEVGSDADLNTLARVVKWWCDQQIPRECIS